MRKRSSSCSVTPTDGPETAWRHPLPTRRYHTETNFRTGNHAGASRVLHSLQTPRRGRTRRWDQRLKSCKLGWEFTAIYSASQRSVVEEDKDLPDAFDSSQSRNVPTINITASRKSPDRGYVQGSLPQNTEGSRHGGVRYGLHRGRKQRGSSTKSASLIQMHKLGGAKSPDPAPKDRRADRPRDVIKAAQGPNRKSTARLQLRQVP